MQAQRRSGSYSNLRTQLERDIEEERQALLEDQKICRLRAHKFSSETNRRRKALEEKRREEEEKEQRFREEVLQQRKQKLQEATEKFQRAHLPPSQRRRPVYTIHRKPTPRLEDALEQIQGSLLSATAYISSANRFSSTRTADFSSSTVPGNGYWFQSNVQSKAEYDKMVQEQSSGNYRTNPIYYKQHLAECQHPLEDQQPNKVEDVDQQTNHLADSVSLSSVDSLENGEGKECSTAHTAAPSLATQEDTLSHKQQRPQSVSSAHLHAAGEDVTRDQAVRNWLLTLNNQNNVSIASDEMFNESTSNSTGDHLKNLSKIENKTPEKSKTHTSHITSASENTNGVFMQNSEDNKVITKSNTWVSQSPAYEMVNRDKLLASGGTAHKPTKAWVTPDPTPRQTGQASAQGNTSEQTHPPGSVLLRMDQYMSTSNIPPSGEQNHTDVPYYSVTSTNSTQESKHFKDITTNAFIHKLDDFLIESNADYTSVTAEQTVSEMNNNSGSAESQLMPKSSTLPSYYNRKDEQDNGSIPTTPLFHTSSREQNKPIHFTEQEESETGLLKGILKKDSKYEDGYSRTLLYCRSISFGNQACIRDSVELTKGKGKDSENQKTNKRLRWFDESKQANADDEEHGSRNHVARMLDYMTIRSVATRGHSSPSNNQEHPTKPVHTTNATGAELVSVPLVSTGYHFTKQAWMSPKKENGTISGNSNDTLKHNLPKGKTKIIRRPRSAKCPDSGYKNRKGAVIRPQSAVEANKVIKTQGKLIIPHPPPKSVPEDRIVQNVMDTACQPSQANNMDKGDTMQSDLNSHKDKPETNPPLHSVMYNNNSVIVMPSPPSYGTPGYETTSKTTVTVNTVQTVAQKETSSALSKRSPLYGENGLRLDRTPTDEEITLLWHGVRNALAQADPNPGELRNYDPHYNNPFALQSSRPNISHVTIDGGNLLTNSKTLLKMNGFFSPTSNGTIALTRRKQILDTNEIKRRALLEQRRHTASSSGWRPQPPAQNALHTIQMKPFPFEPVKTVSGVADGEEVSESTSQFLVAENLVDTSAAEGEILTVMEKMKPNRQNMLLSKAQRVGVSALSFEEQKILHSLDRLNQRLQFVQEAIIRNPSTAGVLQMSSPLNIQQYGSSQPPETTLTLQRYRSVSADNRTKLQRKF